MRNDLHKPIAHHHAPLPALGFALVSLLFATFAAHAQQTGGEPAFAPDPALGIRLFNATFSVTFRGIRAGELNFVLRKAGNIYVYESIAHPRGLARLVINNNVRESSEFVIENGLPKPQRYELDDGSKGTADDTRLTFDWNGNLAKGVSEDKPLQLPLGPNIQDRMSAQIVVMQWLAASKPLTAITFIDRDELKEYNYVKLRDEKIKTQVGEFDTVVIESSRPESNRRSRIWYAPTLGYLPVRGEQERKGKVETVFEIQKMQP